MAKAEWGQKRICPNCASRYYDMKKNPPVCPNCGTAFDPEIMLRARRGRAEKKPANTPAPEAIIEEIPAAAGDDSEDAVIEDAEELGEDDAVEDVVREEEA